jgi:hypothetical protein
LGRYRGIETAQVRQRLIKKGLGQGEGPSYQPWIRVGSFPNRGESFRISCDKTQRSHDYLSTLEYRHHLLCEFLAIVIDIREQYPLPIDETLCLADELGIAHPSVGGEPCTVTLDFMLTLDDGHVRRMVARSIKYCEELKNPRVREKLELERVACIRRLIPWELLTEHELPRVLEKNLRWLRGWKTLERKPPDDDTCREFVDVLCQEDLSQPLGALLDRVAARLGISRLLAIHYFRYAVWTHAIEVDLYSPLQLTKPHTALAVNRRLKRKVA